MVSPAKFYKVPFYTCGLDKNQEKSTRAGITGQN
jgi:hypothetical protein